MPELPEVETVVRDLRAAGLVGCKVQRMTIRRAKLISQPSPQAFARRLRGQGIIAIQRRAKYILLSLNGGATLIVHLGMTGQIRLVSAKTPRDDHEHLWLTFDRGHELRFHDTRMFGHWWLVRDPQVVLGKLGPEPLAVEFSAKDFIQRLAAHRRQLKPLLLDQTFLAGLGNIYADETLWEARLHPKRRSHTLSRPEQARLFRAIRKVLRQGIRFRGTSFGAGETTFYSGNHRRGQNQIRLKAYGRTGEPCPRCRTKIARLLVGQRATHFCPRCQR